MNFIRTNNREVGVAATIVLLNLVLLIYARGYFSRENFVDLFLANAPVLVISLGMLMVILARQIDISVGSMFAVCSVIAGMAAKHGMSSTGSALAACLAGSVCGVINGGLTAYPRVPSIVATLATMIVLRDGLRRMTQGSWVGDLPPGFQMLGLTPGEFTATVFGLVLLLLVIAAAGLRYLRAGRAIFATGSSEDAAGLVGIKAKRVVFSVFTLTGILTGLAAAMNAVRFHQVPSNAGLGL